jgi:predicted secreted protein
VFKLDNASGMLTDISAYVTRVGFSPKADTVEVTTLGGTAKNYIAGLHDATISIEGIFHPAVDTILNAALGASSTRSFEFGPQGSTVGNVRYAGECICTSYEVETGVDGAGTFSAELQISQAVTRGTY